MLPPGHLPDRVTDEAARIAGRPPFGASRDPGEDALPLLDAEPLLGAGRWDRGASGGARRRGGGSPLRLRDGAAHPGA
ncbi:hypothetical protein GCM10027160_31100 [Streptomyces calidiresistens]